MNELRVKPHFVRYRRDTGEYYLRGIYSEWFNENNIEYILERREVDEQMVILKTTILIRNAWYIHFESVEDMILFKLVWT